MGGDDRRASLSSMEQTGKKSKLGAVSGVYIPVCLNIFSILMFLRFGWILGQVGLLGMLGLLVTAYLVDFLTTLSLSAIASNGEVKGGGAYYVISRSLGPEFGGSIGVLFYLAQVLNTALNVVGLIDCIKLNVGESFPQGYWTVYLLQTLALLLCAGLCLAGSGTFAKASNALLVILTLAIVSIPISAAFKSPFHDSELGVRFTGFSVETLVDNFAPHTRSESYKGFETFREVFAILFPATSGIFAGASMSGDLHNPSKDIPKGTLWAMMTTFIAYLVVVFSMAATTTHASFLNNTNIISVTSLSMPLILAGECAVTFFSAVMGLIGAAKLMQALARDKLLPGLLPFSRGTKRADEPVQAILLTYALAQVAMFANLNQIATLISMGYQMTFFVMNLACFLLKIGSAPNFRPAFKFFSWETAFAGSIMSAAAMFFIDQTYAATAVCLLVSLFCLIHYLSPPKRWGDVSQNLIYHQVRKYLLRLRPEHIKFWRPQIILLINNPRSQTRLIQFCNSVKKGGLYILGHVIVTDDFNSGVHEARLQQAAWTKYISEFSRIKAFVQLTMSPTITWGIRNLILSAGLGGMRPNIAVMGFYNMDELRSSRPSVQVPKPPSPTVPNVHRPPKTKERPVRRRRGDTSARLMDGFLPTDVIKTEGMMSVTSYMTMLEDLALRYKLNVAIGKGFEELETPRKDNANIKRHIDLWPIQMSAEVLSDGKSVLTTNFDTYTLILQLGYILYSVPTWHKVYNVRVMVFVEYESEVEEERARVKALLDKLRIEAEVIVFWLASGNLNTYELIINGQSNDIESQIMVHDILKEEEWWDDLQKFRGREPNLDSTEELTSFANIIESTAGRPGVFNPHVPLEDIESGRRPSLVHFGEIPRKPTVSNLSRLGVSVGIHTSHLGDEIFEEESNSDGEISEQEQQPSCLDSDSEFENGDGEYSDDEMPEFEAPRRPLLAGQGRGRGRGRSQSDDLLMGSAKQRRGVSSKSAAPATDYGTMVSQARAEGQSGTSHIGPVDNISAPPTPLERPVLDRNITARSLGGFRSAGVKTYYDVTPGSASGYATPARPTLSRQSSAVRFSSRPVPETRTDVEGTSGPTIMFADTTEEETPRAEQPAFSRQTSSGRVPSRPVPEMKVTAADEPSYPTSTFPEPSCRSRKASVASTTDPGYVHMNMAELVGRYRLDSRVDGSGEGSPYSTQGIALSFNDLPSRAQHVILNELMRQNSKDTAVLFTTLPVPTEGTCHDEQASVQYLSDIEVLCHELPPVMLVLSNNMTVTVGL
ncbi:Amino acid permease [Colletotrichum higginsianum IMI 349063]|uniref:Amino acid permease n=3 Tax=Colletotrichum higginsianum TaxID=80884 RepID=A0A1B7YIV0_COLHI|nr:Amino acid permease [Colletotrichum higginsianum IMI 349063]OBR11920.1 Amino acid permease [Colletotrichum higginsianum IMI 349063]TID00339.1 Vacuolar cation-chloride cotransporter 1 [Colletotrichum higginsianum]